MTAVPSFPVSRARPTPSADHSLATGQRSLRDRSISYPLLPPLTEGCPRTSTAEIQYPVEVAFDLARVERSLFDGPVTQGLARRWAPLLPPLAGGLDLGEGGTPLVATPKLARFAGLEAELYMKDETRNPTWSHKDRLNLVTTSAAVLTGAPGIVVASSGNHGAAAAAFAAAAGLRCIVITSAGSPPSIERFLMSFGAAVVAVPTEARWPLMREVVRRLGFHPVSNLTDSHTGHGYGSEGYKTIAYEIFLQLGRRIPAAVFVPTGYAELFFGIWKGFTELRDLGLTSGAPKMYACEPAARAPLAHALAEGKDVVNVEARPTTAFSIACRVNGYRGILAVRESAGAAVPVADDEIAEAHAAQAASGFWHEISSAAGLAAVRQLTSGGWRPDGPVVFVSTSSGFKGMEEEGAKEVSVAAGDWESFARSLSMQGVSI